MLDALRREQYTGANRCWPCTVGNLVILAGLCSAVAFLGHYVVASALGAVGVGAIALRGYLFPYTPRFGPTFKRLLGGGPVEHPSDGEGSLADAGTAVTDEEELLSTLVDEGVVRADGDRLRLASSVEREWHEAMERLRELPTEALLDEVLDASPAADATIPQHTDRPWIVLSTGEESITGETWLSRPGAIAEVAAARVLEGRVEDPIRLPAARAMRTFLTECPDCGASLERTSAASCCGGYPDYTSVPEAVFACPECDVWLYQVERSA